MNKRLMILALAAVTSAVPLRAQAPVLDSYREAVVSRWEFQRRFPLAAKLFDGRESEAERRSLMELLRPDSAAAPAGHAALPGRAGIWPDFALGVAAEKNRPGNGAADLGKAALKSKGDLALNYEFSRILAQAGLEPSVRPWRMEVHRSMLEKGYGRIPELAKLELRRARAAMQQRRFAAAGRALEFAARLDPLSGWIPFQSLLLHLRERAPFNVDLGIAWKLVKEALRPVRYYDSQALFLVNVSRSLRVGIGVFFAIVLLALFARHFPRIAHPWAEKLPQAVDMRVRYLAIAMVPLSLLVGGAGYALLGLLGTMLLWKHCSKPEKAILTAGVLALASLPFVLTWERSMCRHLDARTGANVYHLAYLRGYERDRVERAAAFPARDREDSLYRSLAVSIGYKKQGNYPRAEEYARQASLLDPDGAFPLLISGNLAMATVDYSKAARLYGKARRQAPDLVETWFNSSQAELYNNNSAHHKEYLERAAEIDAPWITQWLRDNDENFPVYPATRKAMDPMLPAGEAWHAAGRSLLQRDFLRVRVHTGILDAPGAWLLIAALIAALGLYLRFRGHTRHSHGRELFECRICGRTLCRTCRKGMHCQQCFKTVAGLHEARIRSELVARLRLRSVLPAVRIGSALNAIFPGAGHLYLNRKGRFAWVMAVSLLFGAWYGMSHLLMEYPAFALGPLSWLPCLPLVALYVAFNLGQLFTSIDPKTVLPGQPAREREAAR